MGGREGRGMEKDGEGVGVRGGGEDELGGIVCV